MRVNLTLEDIKHIIEQVYNGNLAKSRATKNAVPYYNENSETILLNDERGRFIGKKDLAEYLNIHFYTWRNRVVDAEGGKKIPLDAWVESLNASLNDAYALIELTNSNAVPSQDLDSALLSGRITMIIQANKAANLDYYATKLRNKYLGEPQEFDGLNGEKLTAYFNLGIVLYEGEPYTMQLGECVTVSINFTINYVTAAYTYKDMEFSFALGEDPDEEEEEDLYEKLPITKGTFVSSFTSSAVPYYSRPDITGVNNTAVSNTWTLGFFDFKQPFTEKLAKYCWELGASQILDETDGETQPEWENTQVSDLNLPLFVKLKVHYSDGDISYKYKYTITEMRKEIVNGEFTVCALTLRGRSRAEIEETPEVEVM